MVAEPDSVKLIRILQTGTEFVVVLKLGDDSDVMARTFDTLNAAEHYADVCASILNGESVEYTEPNQDHEEGEAVSSNNTEANMNNGQDDADSWDDDSEPQTEASALPDEDSWDDWDDDSEPQAETSATPDEDSWDDWDDDSEPKAETPAVPEEDSWDLDSEPEATNPLGTDDADSWDDWDDDSDEPEQAAKPKSDSTSGQSGQEAKKNTVKADIQQAEAEKGQSTTKDKADEAQPKKKRRRSAKRREALSFTPVDEDSDAWSPEWGDDSAEDWHDE